MTLLLHITTNYDYKLNCICFLKRLVNHSGNFKSGNSGGKGSRVVLRIDMVHSEKQTASQEFSNTADEAYRSLVKFHITYRCFQKIYWIGSHQCD